MSGVVVVIRTEGGDDILALMRGELDGIVKIECPYYVKFNPATSNVIMVPYCPLSDERYFELNKGKIQFLVTANKEISSKFLKMVEMRDQLEEFAAATSDPETTEPESDWLSATFVKGSDTKH